eukprot:2364231-Amphidinium_carterae.1
MLGTRSAEPYIARLLSPYMLGLMRLVTTACSNFHSTRRIKRACKNIESASDTPTHPHCVIISQFSADTLQPASALPFCSPAQMDFVPTQTPLSARPTSLQVERVDIRTEVPIGGFAYA